MCCVAFVLQVNSDAVKALANEIIATMREIMALNPLFQQVRVALFECIFVARRFHVIGNPCSTCPSLPGGWM
jgi:hypothetical protein